MLNGKILYFQRWGSGVGRENIHIYIPFITVYFYNYFIISSVLGLIYKSNFIIDNISIGESIGHVQGSVLSMVLDIH
jgi:hypothetical protein